MKSNAELHLLATCNRSFFRCYFTVASVVLLISKVTKGVIFDQKRQY